MLTFNEWGIEALTGYKPKTTYWMDFSIADAFGTDAIRETYETAFEAGKDYLGVEYLTELAMVLNWKIWEHFHANNDEYADLYDELWKTTDRWCVHNLEGEDIAYYYRTTD